jgi:chromosome segregation ATPase
MKQLPNFLIDPATELESELGQINENIRAAARRGDEAQLVVLRSRLDELPELIYAEKLRALSQRINEARTRWGAFDADAQAAGREAQSLNAELEPKLNALEREKAQLIGTATQAMTDRENLQFAAKQALNEFEGLLKQRESLLLERHS